MCDFSSIWPFGIIYSEINRFLPQPVTKIAELVFFILKPRIDYGLRLMCNDQLGLGGLVPGTLSFYDFLI